MEFKLGQRVRSYDFPDRMKEPDAAYVEGEVVAYKEIDGTQRCVIGVDLVFFGRREKRTKTGQTYLVYPPVNGTLTLFGNVTNGIVAV